MFQKTLLAIAATLMTVSAFSGTLAVMGGGAGSEAAQSA